jgi:hypothetical protein
MGWMGTHPPSGKQLIADYITIYRIQGNQIAEAWAEWDNLYTSSLDTSMTSNYSVSESRTHLAQISTR